MTRKLAILCVFIKTFNISKILKRFTNFLAPLYLLATARSGVYFTHTHYFFM